MGWIYVFPFFVWEGGYTGRSIAEPRSLNCRVIAKVSCCEPVSRSGIITPKWGGGAAILAPKSPKMLNVYESRIVFRRYNVMIHTVTTAECREQTFNTRPAWAVR